MAFERLCALAEVRAGEVAEFSRGRERFIAVRLPDGTVAVYQGLCPHQQMALAEGRFDGRVLECRAHGWTFDLETGRGIEPAFCFLARYPVEIKDGCVSIEHEGRLL